MCAWAGKANVPLRAAAKPVGQGATELQLRIDGRARLTHRRQSTRTRGFAYDLGAVSTLLANYLRGG